MAAASIDIAFLQGETYDQTTTWKTGTPATAVDLTGYTARSQVRETVASTSILLELTTENGGIVLGGVAGTIQLLVTATVTAAFSWTTGRYDVEMIAPSGAIRRLMAGIVTVSQEVTR